MSQQAQLDAMIVKRIQEACAAEKSGRAMDLASLLSLEKSFHIAMKVRIERRNISGGEGEEGGEGERGSGIIRRGFVHGGASAFVSCY